MQDNLSLNQEEQLNGNTKMLTMVLKDLVIMPGANVHFDIQTPASVQAVNRALEANAPLFVVLEHTDTDNKEYGTEDVHRVGTITEVKQVLKMPGGKLKALLEGKGRAKVQNLTFTEAYYMAEVTPIPEADPDMFSDNEKEARIRAILDLLKTCTKLQIVRNEGIYEAFRKVDKLERLVDMVAEAVPFKAEQMQEILAEENLDHRVDVLLSLLLNEISIAGIRTELSVRLRECVEKNQKEYVLREQMKVIRKELGEDDTQQEGDHYREKLKELALPEAVEEKLLKEIKRFESLAYASSESAVLRNYIETVLEYPWNCEGTDQEDFQKAVKQLEADHYGLKQIKERIIDYLATRILSGRKDAPILCLVGPPGTGKTSIARSIATALHKEYGRISLGGVKDEAEIRGHRKTYIGAMPGRIVTEITRTGVKNPLILLDEIDKTGNDYKNDTASALLEVLDGEQNVQFIDHYFEVPVDLSGVLFIATANDASQIPEPLRDRMELVEVNSYTENEKFHIAKLYLLGKQRKKNGLNARQFRITDDALHCLIRRYTREAGVRRLEQLLGQLMQKACRMILTGEAKSLYVTTAKLTALLGAERYPEDEDAYMNRVGVANGLAWTRVGGDLLRIEVNILDGKGGLTLTGNLGDVMKESAQIAFSFVRTRFEMQSLAEDYFEKHTIHVHVPEGATPKDGPSAGITMALAIYSALLNRPIDGRLAMTGEISLKGNVLPIGGLKEKLLAAKNAGMQRVLVPAKNQRNVSELDPEITEGMEILYVSHADEVLEKGIVKRRFALKQKKEEEK